ncbi:MAG: hypothetical protein AB7G13_03945 [Lautropia sp.]
MRFVPGRPLTLADIAVRLHDGTLEQATADTGRPDADLNRQELRLVAKFDALALPCIGGDAARSLRERALALDAQPDLEAIAAALRFR